VLNDLRMVDREVHLRDGAWVLVRVRPYRTTDNRIDGVVITFQDIADRRLAEDSERRGQERLRLLIDGATEYAIFTMTEAGVIDSWNAGAERLFEYRADEIIGRGFDVLYTPEDRSAGVPAAELEQAVATGHVIADRFQTRRNGSRFFCNGSMTRLGEALGFATIARDLSVQREAAEAQRVVEAEFDVRMRERTGRLEAEVHARESAHHYVSELLRKIVTAQEDERARIARDLHDQLGQQLTALRLALEQHRDRLAAAGTTVDDVNRALTLASEIDNEVDFLAWELRPAVLDDLGLAAALPRFVRDWSAHYRLPAEYRAAGFTSGQLSREAELVFYRVAQEALTNVVKHAHASRADVLLEAREGFVVLVVEDDGIGFEPSDPQTRDKGIGLAGMRERAQTIGAELEIEAAPGQGTSVFLRCTNRAAKPDAP
jgi:PAS domain S-box-containing protein